MNHDVSPEFIAAAAIEAETMLRSQLANRDHQIEALQAALEKEQMKCVAFSVALLACQRRAYISMDWQHEAYIAGVLGVKSLTAIDKRKDDAP